jgi:hypothetical protein
MTGSSWPSWATPPSPSLSEAAITAEAASAPLPTGHSAGLEAKPDIASKAGVEDATKTQDSKSSGPEREKLEQLTAQLAEIEKIGVWISYGILVVTALIPLLAIVIAILPLFTQARIEREIKDRLAKTERDFEKRFADQDLKMSEATRKIESDMRELALEIVRKEIKAVIEREYGMLISNYLDLRLEEMSLNSDGGRAAVAGLATEYLHPILEVTSHPPNEPSPPAASLLDQMLTIWQTLGQIFSLDRKEHEQAFMKLIDSHPTRHALPRLRWLLAEYRNAGGAQDERLAQLAEQAIKACEGDTGVRRLIQGQ